MSDFNAELATETLGCRGNGNDCTFDCQTCQ